MDSPDQLHMPAATLASTPDSNDELGDDGGHDFSRPMCKMMYNDSKKSKAMLFAVLVGQIDGGGVYWAIQRKPCTRT